MDVFRSSARVRPREKTESAVSLRHLRQNRVAPGRSARQERAKAMKRKASLQIEVNNARRRAGAEDSK